MVALGALIGPRIAIVAWWLLDPFRWAHAFRAGWPLAVLGFLFLPWTTLVFVWLAPLGPIGGLGLLWLVLALIVDLSSYGGGYRSRRWV
ncbi:MAG: hypothetical protein KGJ98_14980 [Chloroflexota bacterium]|nr:hypothetical protein [Chloroflexota bacterium]